MGAIEIQEKISIGTRIHITILNGILILKRVKRLIRRLIKEMGFSFLITAVLMAAFVLLLVWVRLKNDKNPNIVDIILDYMPMIYTSIVVTFVGNAINSERHRNRCLNKQYFFYAQMLSYCEEYMNRLLFELGLGNIRLDFYDNNSIQTTENNIPIFGIVIEKELSDRILRINNQFVNRLDDFPKIWLGYEFIDCDLQMANRDLSLLKDEVINLNNNTVINTESIRYIIAKIHLLLANFRKPWRYDSTIDNKIRKLQGVQKM